MDSRGDISLSRPDTQSAGWTQLGFLVYDTVDSVNVTKPLTIRVETAGPNGGAFLTLSGVSN